MTNHTSLSVGILLFDGVTQLDFTGPYEVLARMPGTHVSLLAPTLEPVRTEWGLTITPDLVERGATARCDLRAGRLGSERCSHE
jgi:Putative intracellular protease/amidase